MEMAKLRIRDRLLGAVLRRFPAAIGRRAGLVLVAVAWSACSVAVGAPYTWDASGGAPLADGAGNWNASGGTNWFDGTAYGAWGNLSTDSATFGVGSGAAGTVTVGGVTADAITFNAPGSGNYTLSSGTITLAGTTPTITVNATGTSTISSVLAGSAGLTKTGAGTLSLGTANTYTGTTTISQGVVRVTALANTLGNGSTGSVVLNGGGILAAWTTSTTPTWAIAVGANGGTIEGSGNAGRWQFSANRLSGAGTLTLRSSGTFSRFVGADQSASGFSGKWILDGTGGAFFSASGDNNFGATPGAATADAVTLINDFNLAATNTVGVSVGSSTRGFTIGTGGGRFGAAGTNVLTVAGAIASTGTDVVRIYVDNNGAGVRLSNSGNSYAGDTNLLNLNASNKTLLRVGANEVIPNGSGKGNVLLNAVGVLDLNGFNETINGLSGAVGSFVMNTATNTTATLAVGDNNATSTFAGTIQDTSGGVAVAIGTSSGTFTSPTGGVVALVKAGTGVFTLSGSNTFSGGTVVRAGSLDVANSGALGAGGVVLNGSTSRPTLNLGADVTGVTMTLDGTLRRPIINATGAGTRTWNGSVVLTGTATSDGAPQFVSDGVPLTILGTVTGSNGGQGLLFRGSNLSATLGAAVSIGSMSLTKADTGRWTVTSSGNQWGATSITGGSLRAGINDALPTATAVTLASGFGATLDLNSFDLEIGSLAGGGATDGAVTLGSGRLTLGGANTNTTFSGVISGSGGRLRKIGTGTQTLSGVNTYTGETTISAGRLALGAGGSIASSTLVTIGDAGSLAAVLDLTAKSGTFSFGQAQTVAGIGTIDIGAGKTVEILGTLAPGNSPGLLSITGDLLLGGTSTTLMEIDNVTRGAGHDAVDISGLLTYGGSLNLDFGSIFADGETFDLFNFASQAGSFSSIVASGSYSATLANNGFGVWTGLAANGQTLSFTQSDGVLTFLAVPEPTTATGAGIGFMLVGWSMWRRRQGARRSA